MRPAYFIVLLLGMISYLIVDGRVVKPQASAKYELQQRILTGQEESQQQYSILTSAVTFSVQKLLGVVVVNNTKLRLYSFEIVALLSFMAFFLIFYFYLRIYFDENQSITGLLLMQAVLSIVIQNIYTEAAIFNLTFFAIGLLLIALKRDFLLPLIITLGAMNQSQILALLLFYMIYQFSMGRLFKLRVIVIAGTSLVSWLVVESLLKSFYGIRNAGLDEAPLLVNIPSLIIIFSILFLMSYKSLFQRDKIFKFSLLFTPLYILLSLMLMPQANLLDLSPVLLFILPPALFFFTPQKS